MSHTNTKCVLVSILVLHIWTLLLDVTRQRIYVNVTQSRREHVEARISTPRQSLQAQIISGKSCQLSTYGSCRLSVEPEAVTHDLSYHNHPKWSRIRPHNPPGRTDTHTLLYSYIYNTVLRRISVIRNRPSFWARSCVSHTSIQPQMRSCLC